MHSKFTSFFNKKIIFSGLALLTAALLFGTTTTASDSTGLSYAFKRGGHSGDINALSFTANGNLLVSSSDDHTVKVWDMKAGGTLVQTFKTPGMQSTAAVISPDGSKLFIGDYDANVYIYDVTSGELLDTIDIGDGQVSAMSISQDGAILAASNGDYETHKINVANGESEKKKTDQSMTMQTAFSPDGAYVAIAYLSGTTKVINTGNWGTKKNLGDHEASVLGTAFSPDSTKLATVGLDGKLFVYDVSDNFADLLEIDAHEGKASSVAFTTDSKKVITGGADKVIRVWDVATGEEVASAATENADVCALAVSSEGLIASGCRNNSVQTRTLDNLSAPTKLTFHTDRIIAQAMSDALGVVATAAEDGKVNLWNPRSGELVNVIDRAGAQITALAMDAVNGLIAVGEGSLTAECNVFNINDLSVSFTMKDQTAGVTALAFNPSGSILASAGGYGDDQIRLWDATSGALQGEITLNHSNGISKLFFTTDGSKLIAGGGYKNNTVQVYAVDSKSLLATIEQDEPVALMAVSPNGATLATSGGPGYAKVYLWEVATGNAIDELTVADAGVNALSFSLDGKVLAAAMDGMILFDMETLSPLQYRTSGIAGVSAMAFSSNSNYLAYATSGASLMFAGNPEGPVMTFFPQTTVLLNGWFNSPWFGAFQGDSFGLIWHNDHGWLYCGGGNADGMWMWSDCPELGWMWIAPGSYPMLLSSVSNNWMFYEVGTRWFYDYGSSEWKWIALL